MAGFTQAALQAAVAAKKRMGRTNQFTAGTATKEGELKRSESIAKARTGTKATKESKAKALDTKRDKARVAIEENPDDLPAGFFTTDGDEEEYVDF